MHESSPTYVLGHSYQEVRLDRVGERLQDEVMTPSSLHGTIAGPRRLAAILVAHVVGYRLAITGLAAYSEDGLTRDIASRWLRKNIDAYEESGVLLEKYDVETVTIQHGGSGGEYPLQVGFGWTNGVLADLIARYPREAAEALHHRGAVAP